MKRPRYEVLKRAGGYVVRDAVANVVMSRSPDRDAAESRRRYLEDWADPCACDRQTRTPCDACRELFDLCASKSPGP